jgi:hypothetical protein
MKKHKTILPTHTQKGQRIKFTKPPSRSSFCTNGELPNFYLFGKHPIKLFLVGPVWEISPLPKREPALAIETVPVGAYSVGAGVSNPVPKSCDYCAHILE